jgi:hypothetical protein
LTLDLSAEKELCHALVQKYLQVMTQHKSESSTAGYRLDREELIRIRNLRLLTSDRDYVFFALQIDFPGKLNPSVEVEAFCQRWELSDGNLYKALRIAQ